MEVAIITLLAAWVGGGGNSNDSNKSVLFFSVLIPFPDMSRKSSCIIIPYLKVDT